MRDDWSYENVIQLFFRKTKRFESSLCRFICSAKFIRITFYILTSATVCQIKTKSIWYEKNWLRKIWKEVRFNFNLPFYIAWNLHDFVWKLHYVLHITLMIYEKTSVNTTQRQDAKIQFFLFWCKSTAMVNMIWNDGFISMYPMFSPTFDDFLIKIAFEKFYE